MRGGQHYFRRGDEDTADGFISCTTRTDAGERLRGGELRRERDDDAEGGGPSLLEDRADEAGAGVEAGRRGDHAGDERHQAAELEVQGPVHGKLQGDDRG